MEPMIALSHELKRLRVERHLSQERLAAHAGISQAVLSRCESGKRQPTLKTLAKLAPALGVRTFDFGSGRLSNSATADIDADLRRSCEHAIRLARAGSDLPPLPALRREAQRLGLPGWELLSAGDATEGSAA